MLKTRVIPVLLLRSGSLVKGRGFGSWRVVGSPVQAARIYEARQVDELVILDIAATPEGRGPDFAVIEELTGECFMPLTVGGGVRTLDHIRRLLACGADKVAINTAAVDNPTLIREAAQKFGCQAVVVSIDAKGGHVTTNCGTKRHDMTAVEWARMAEHLGAGEILLNDVDRDGTLDGYNLDLIARVCEAVKIPVVACGGAGSGGDMAQAIGCGAHAVAAGALWQFTEHTPLDVKRHLATEGVPVRL